MKHIYKLLNCILIVLLFVSCDKNNDGESVSDDNSLVFEIQGINDIADKVAIADKKVASAALQNQHINTGIEEKIIGDRLLKGTDEVFVRHTEINLESPSKSKDVKDLQAKSSPLYPANYNPLGTGSTSALQTTVKYRVLVYKMDDSYVGTIDAVVGSTAPRLNVDGGVSYKWFAYSYNSADALPTIDPLNPITTVENEDFIFASGTIAAVTGEKKIPITFVRKMATIQVMTYTTAFSAYGDFSNWGAPTSNPNATYVKLSNLVGGNFDILNGSFIPSSYTVLTDHDKTIINTRTSGTGAYLPDPNAPSTSVTGYAYTIPNSPSINTDVDVKVGIKMPYDPSVIRYIQPLSGPIPFSNVKTVEGVMSRLYIMPMDKTISAGNPSSPTQWAKGYLVNYFGDNFKPYINGTTTLLPLGPYEKHNWIRQLTPDPNDINIPYTANSLSSGTIYGYDTKLLPETFRVSQTGSQPYEEVYPRKYYRYGLYLPLPYSTQSPLKLGNPCDKTVPYINGKLGFSDLDIPIRWRLPTVAEGQALADNINANLSNVEVRYNDATRLLALTYYPNASHIGMPDSWFNNAMIFYLDGYNDQAGALSTIPTGYGDDFDGITSGLQGFRGSPYAVGRATGENGLTHPLHILHTSAVKPSPFIRKSSVNIRLEDGDPILNSNNSTIAADRNKSEQYKRVLRISYDESATPTVKAEVIFLHQSNGVEVRCVRKL